jgi:hypothetical protein
MAGNYSTQQSIAKIGADSINFNNRFAIPLQFQRDQLRSAIFQFFIFGNSI